MKYCRRRKATTLFPEGLTIPKGARKQEKHILQPNDLVKLFASEETVYRGAAVPDPLIHAYRFQVLTGLRSGELLGLEWRDISDGKVFIKRSINRDNEVTKGKNENAARCFVISESAKRELEAQREINMFGRVFGLLTQDTYRCRWKAYCKHQGITPTTPYELRHTFVSIAKTPPEGSVKALVGHSRNMDTFSTYGHMVTGEMEQTTYKIEGIFEDILQSVL